MSGYLLAFLALAALLMAYFGSIRAKASHAGAVGKVHSRPIYHGLNVAIWTAIPAFVLLLVWLVFQSSVINYLVLSAIPVSDGLDLSASSILMSEVRQVAA
ncbi:MAG: phosphate ABC transporter permease family protein, partial [Allorhizobium sp.]